MENEKALEIAEKLQKDVEIWYLEQNRQIQELKEKCNEILSALAYLSGKPNKLN